MKRAFAAIASAVHSRSDKFLASGVNFSPMPTKTSHTNEKKRKSCDCPNQITLPNQCEKKRRISQAQHKRDRESKGLSLVKSSTSHQEEKMKYILNTLSPNFFIKPLYNIIKYNQQKVPDKEEACLRNLRKPHLNETSEHLIPIEFRGSKLDSKLMNMIPCEVLCHCLFFLPLSDRPSLLCVCKKFRKVCNSHLFLRNIVLGGEPLSGRGSFILENDTRETAIKRLYPLFKAGNLEACHMIGVIKAYCYDDVKTGIRFLGIASKSGCIRSSYVLGLVLRDTRKKESTEFLVRAASEGYLPALQELLPAKEMKEKYGEPSAVELGAYFDSVGLGRLLRRSYSQYPRNLNASHCWNPYCGRWAYKSEKNGGSAVIPHDSNSRNTPNPEHLGQSNPSNSPRVHEVGSSTVNSSSDSISRSYQGTNDHTMKENSSQNHTENRAMCIVINRVSRMKMCSSCRRAKYCSKLCQVYDWRSGRHKKECRRI